MENIYKKVPNSNCAIYVPTSRAFNEKSNISATKTADVKDGNIILYGKEDIRLQIPINVIEEMINNEKQRNLKWNLTMDKN